MTQLALNILGDEAPELVKPVLVTRIESQSKAPSRTIIKLGAILILLQVLDGVLTGIGMNIHGTAAEGNIFLRMLMEQWGYIPAIVTVKTFAIGVVCVLCMLSSMVAWIKHAMRVIIGIYLLAAVIPWAMILTSGHL